MELYREVTIRMDIIFVNKLTFLLAIYRGINFVASEYLINRMEDIFLGTTKRVKHIYNRTCFGITHCNVGL